MDTGTQELQPIARDADDEGRQEVAREIPCDDGEDDRDDQLTIDGHIWLQHGKRRTENKIAYLV